MFNYCPVARDLWADRSNVGWRPQRIARASTCKDEEEQDNNTEGNFLNCEFMAQNYWVK